MALPTNHEATDRLPKLPGADGMVVLRYPRNSLMGDYLRSAVGLAIGCGVLLSVPASPVIILVFGSVAVLFAVFGLRTLQRQILHVAVTDGEIATSDVRTRSMAWDQVTRVRVRFYGMRRDRAGKARGGFIELLLKGPAGTMRFESSLEGFDLLAWHAARAARRHGATIDSTSAGNLVELGIDPDGEQDRPIVTPHESGEGST